MQPLAEALTKALGNPSMGKQLFEQINEINNMPPEERQRILIAAEKRKIDRYNAEQGHLNESDGYDCKLCKNRGNTGYIEVVGNSIYRHYPECRCMEIRRSIHRMKMSGLESSIRENTFKRFEAKEPWQTAMIEIAQKYLSDGVNAGYWLYMGGQPGCGKTHICTAVAGKLLYEYPLIYVVWPQISKCLKALVTDAEEYEKEIGRLQRIKVLYIDDLFKPIMDEGGRTLPPTTADLKLAFELLNYRYINKLPTIMSSELDVAELVDLDEATGSRIVERSKGFCLTIGRDKKRNHRMNNETVV